MICNRKTAMDILKQVRDRINNIECTKESSYGMFLRLLGKYYMEQLYL